MNFTLRGRHARRPFLILAALALAGAVGCGPSKGSVSGTVKFNGQPLPSGTITFLSDAGNKQAVSAPITDGKYSIPNMEAGPGKVTVVTTPPSTAGTPPKGMTIEPTGSATPPPAGKYVAVPRKYASPELSGLTYELISGNQTKDFDLAP